MHRMSRWTQNYRIPFDWEGPVLLRGPGPYATKFPQDQVPYSFPGVAG